jgi:2-oxo-4-hydroxy-4-carboxy-5-ureidoimidazoline decarboxylase
VNWGLTPSARRFDEIEMRLEDLNALDADAAARELLRCCGSSRWAERMAVLRPFAGAEALADAAESVFATLDRADWLAAFAAHPKIGAGGSGRPGGVDGSGSADGPDADWSQQEQAGAAVVPDATRLRLGEANRDYEARFGYIFIVCATGKSAAEMLDVLERRMGNDPETEIRIAANEQRKITHLRLMKLVDRKQDTTE